MTSESSAHVRETAALPERLVSEEQKVGRRSNLAFALRKLPPEIRRDMLIFYQFCRVLDDVADEEGPTVEMRAAILDEWERALREPRLLPADLRDVFQRHRIPPELPLEILAGVRSDLEPPDLADFEALRKYCRQVAVAVGLVSNRITGCRTEAATLYAEELGLALQLTNILRDVAEDAQRGRCYFPRNELADAELTTEGFRCGKTSPAQAEFFAAQGRRAAEHFARAREVFPPEDARALSAARAMSSIYEALLHQMAARQWRVLEKRASLPLWQKLWCLLVS